MRGTTFIRDLKSIIIRQLKVLVIISLLILISMKLLDQVNISTSARISTELVLLAIALKLVIVPSHLVKIHTNYSREMKLRSRK